MCILLFVVWLDVCGKAASTRATEPQAADDILKISGKVKKKTEEVSEQERGR